MTDILAGIKRRVRDRAVTATLADALTASTGDTSVTVATGQGARFTSDFIVVETDDWNAATGVETMLLPLPDGDVFAGVVRAYDDASSLAAHAIGVNLRIDPRLSINSMMDEALAIARVHLWPWVWKVSHRTVAPDLSTELYAVDVAGVKGAEYAYQVNADLRYEIPIEYVPPEEVDPVAFPNGAWVIQPDEFIDESSIFVAAKIIPVIAGSPPTTGDDGIDDLIALGASSRIIETEAFAAAGPDNSSQRKSVNAAARLQVGEVTWARFENDREALRAALLTRQEDRRAQYRTRLRGY